MVSMSGNSGPRFEWSLPRVRSRRNFWSRRPRSQSNPPLSVYVLKPERRPSEDEGEKAASEQDPADGAEGGNPDEEEEEAAASGGEVGWSAPASPRG